MKNETLSKWILLAAIGVLSAGCAVTQSSNVKTSGMYVSFSVTGDSQSSAEAQVVFQVGGSDGTYIELSPGDTITCNGIELEKQQVPIIGSVSYVGAMAYQPGQNYTFVFSRQGESPYTAAITLPEAAVISAPVNNATSHIGQPLQITWTADSDASDSTQVEYDTANQYVQSQSPDTGSFVVPGTETASANPNSYATIKLTHTRSGTVPSAFQGGSLTASQQASVQVDMVP